jgi:hypothetical protein
MRYLRHAFSRLGVALVLLTAIGASPAAAVPLISFTDNDSLSESSVFLRDTSSNWAVSWTQSVATSNVTLRALIDGDVGVSAANWWITDLIGPATLDPANVIHAGSYTAQDIPTSTLDFNGSPRTTLATGLSFAAGTYYLVLDGPPGQSSRWVGDMSSAVDVNLAPGFTLGTYSVAVPSQPFGPASAWAPRDNNRFYVFELESVAIAVPEPATWLLFAGGLLGVGFASRRGRALGEAAGGAG